MSEKALFSGASKGGNGSGPFTGMAAVRPIVANPTAEQYTKITGKEPPYELNYEKREVPTATGGTLLMQPIHILVENVETGRFDFMRFFCANEDETSSTGSIRFINHCGNCVYSKSEEDLKSNEKMSWFTSHNFSVLKMGMEPICNFLKTLMGIKDDPEFIGDLEKNSCDFDNLYKGNVEGLNKVLDWCNIEENSYHICVLYTVRKREDSEGEVKLSQIIETGKPNLNLFFYASKSGDTYIAPNSSILYLKTLEKKRKASGYEITPNLYSYDFMQFSEEDCVPKGKITEPVDAPADMDDVV